MPEPSAASSRRSRCFGAPSRGVDRAGGRHELLAASGLELLAASASKRMSTAPHRPKSEDPREETAAERLDRNLEELTGELRVVVTGVQVLFAFLLVVPFDARFARVSAFERTSYLVALLLAAAAAACMIGPSAAHRVLFRAGHKAQLVRFSNALTIAGLAFLALAISGSLMLVVSVLAGTAAGVLACALTALALALLWFGLPLLQRGRASRG